jgi:cytochrome c peroxidase
VGAGDLSPAAERGRALFDGLGCKVCHADPRLTDSRFVAPAQPLLHDVGTLRSSSGGRLGGPLLGIDTPTLFGLWTSAPYLHDGSAATLEEVLIDRNPGDAHGPISARTPAQVADLVAYLLSL